MTAPTIDPKPLRIMDALCVSLRTILQANGYYNDVVGVGIEPLDFDITTTYPQIVLQGDLQRLPQGERLGLGGIRGLGHEAEADQKSWDHGGSNHHHSLQIKRTVVRTKGLRAMRALGLAGHPQRE